MRSEADAPPCGRLFRAKRAVDLYSNNIGDEGAKALAVGVAASGSLTHLNLRENNIGDEGAKAIAAAVAASGSLTLKKLSVSSEVRGNTDLVAACESKGVELDSVYACLLYTSPSPRDRQKSRLPSSA